MLRAQAASLRVCACCASVQRRSAAAVAATTTGLASHGWPSRLDSTSGPPLRTVFRSRSLAGCPAAQSVGLLLSWLTLPRKAVKTTAGGRRAATPVEARARAKQSLDSSSQVPINFLVSTIAILISLPITTTTTLPHSFPFCWPTRHSLICCCCHTTCFAHVASPHTRSLVLLHFFAAPSRLEAAWRIALTPPRLFNQSKETSRGRRLYSRLHY